MTTFHRYLAWETDDRITFNLDGERMSVPKTLRRIQDLEFLFIKWRDAYMAEIAQKEAFLARTEES